MSAKRMALLFLLASAVILSPVGCASPGPRDTPVPPESPPEVLAARDAALAYLIEHYGEQAPWRNFIWLEQESTPEGVVGQMAYQYAAGDWVVKVSHAVVAPEWTVYHVAVSNESTGFEWDGRVDGSGRVPEAPENALIARDQAMLHVSEQYGLSGLGAGLAWQEERLTPENIVGGETYQYTAGDWVVTVCYPVVLPENTIYTITVTSEASGFEWEGQVDPQGVVTED